MSCGKCAKCDKTVYQTEKVDAANKVWHKLCFKCADDHCGMALSLKNFQAHEGMVYCNKHVPAPKATAVADSVSVKAALSAPKKTAEGLGTAQKGTGEKPTVGAESISVAHATSAPKVRAEGLGTAKKGTD